ncbi:Poly (ADP-ribose) polymerase 1 [Ananas comosus]|uniref:Poly [ADP-ribose] polymerase n=1 Tax=Ananas comosus TaxID=4615 RepID=A0A199W597_ANACO|nr:Poly (ADP-ribose) polymerase 1 [Ananas comosus]
MANPPKPWKAEYAKSGRSSCKACKDAIAKDQLRLGKMVAATQFDGFMPMWNHASCIFKKGSQIKSLDDVEGYDLLRWDDQQQLRKYVEGGLSSTAAVANNECAIEVSQTSRAACRRCNQKIMKGTVRVSTKPEGQGAKGLAWHHVNCFVEMSPSTNLEKIYGWDTLSLQDKETVFALVKKDVSGKKADEHSQQATSKGTKRKKGDGNSHACKVPRLEESNLEGGIPRMGNAVDSGQSSSNSNELERKLKEQSDALWKIKDELKKHVTVAELREVLEANDQDSAGSEYDLRDRCSSAIFYKKWFKTQKVKKLTRVLPPPSPAKTLSSKVGMQTQSSNGEALGNLKVALVGKSKQEIEKWSQKLDAAGAKVHAKIKKDTNCLAVCGELDNDNAEIKKARRMKLPIVREEYLDECVRKNKMLPSALYKVESASESSRSSTVTVKVKGRSAVHEASGLQDAGHILEVGKSIYNTTLNMSDLSTSVNSYYILQVIEEDKGSQCYVFRKWGRVGNDRIGGTKLEEMSKSDAIQEFRRLFLEKTGNPWEAWEKKQFQKQPGKFYPLDIDYGVKQLPKKKDPAKEKSSLPPQLIELMKMLFNVETYRAAMLEFEINMSEMPLGKLSKENIQKGFEALTEIQNLLSSEGGHDPAVRESLLIDSSNRFFTLIPSIHPHVIRHDEEFKAKVKMLEALQDIEIASRLVGFDGENDESLDEKYKKLRCDLTPLPHDSEDYKLVEKYLLNTHAPTHKDWTLELEEVFTLEREGEFDKYAPYRDKLQNKMLLWHAPPEAPATGYMFGKGIYFADLVSKSAQYCYVDKKDPVGLMLLSEVALGEVHELKKATYMDKPPKGKHSTKGLGKTVPLESEFVKWKEDVIVPCGKPVPSSIRASELLYNEYIVYNTAQVKMQFLLKVRFHHKR